MNNQERSQELLHALNAHAAGVLSGPFAVVATVTDADLSPEELAVSLIEPALVVVGRRIATATPCQVVRLPVWKEETSVGSPVPTAVSSPSPVTAKSSGIRASGRSVREPAAPCCARQIPGA